MESGTMRIVILLCCLLVSFSASAIPIDHKLTQLQHESWKAKDGVPPSIISMAQTDDGYLWLGTAGGLYRFDGARFEAFVPREGTLPKAFVYFIKAQPGVGLWVGWRLGGISLIRDGKVTHYGEKEGVSAGSWWGFSFDRHGDVWAAGVDGLLQFDGSKWHKNTAVQGFTARKASAVLVDKDDTVAVFSDDGLFLKPYGATNFAAPLGHTDVRQPPQQDAQGRLYFLEQRGIRIIDGFGRYEKIDHPWIFKEKPSAAQSMLIDSSGSLWFETNGGLRRTDPDNPAHQESFNKKDGLSADLIFSFFEDREGNVWVSTSGGLDRFRQLDINKVTPSIARFTMIQGRLLAGDADVMTYANANTDGGWIALKPDGAVQNAAWLNKHPNGAVQATIRSGDGTIWVADREALHHLVSDRKIESIAYPADMGPVHLVHEMTQDGDGAIWISVVGAGVFRYKNGRWGQEAMLPQAGKRPAMSMMADQNGRMWFGYANNVIAILDQGKVSHITRDQGLDVGRVTVLYQSGKTIFAGGEKGVAVYRNQRFEPWKIPVEGLLNVSAILVSKVGDIWLNSSSGTIRIKAADINADADFSSTAKPRLFDAVDGRLGVTDLMDNFSLAEAGDGKIWISTQDGVSWVDPQKLLTPTKPPKVVIEGIISGNQRVRQPVAESLAPNSRNVQIDYSSPLLGAPERLQFKYRLDGYDTEWQSAGSRRQALYTSLGPGRYHFRAIAGNGEDRWSDEGHGLYFTIEPAFYQTAWFKALLAGATLILIWLLYQLRIRQVALAIKRQMDARHAERERIARELHDTLLQGTQAMIMRVHTASLGLEPDDPALEKIQYALTQADAILAEGRDQVHDLRGNDLYEAGAMPLISRDGAILAQEAGLQFIARSSGRERALQPASSHEIYRIAMEVIANAVQHSKGTRISVDMRYDFRGMLLQMSDDGIGLPNAVLEAGKVPGHFGLPGLHERAARLHARLQVESKAGAGTTVKLHVPARMSYL
jgi:signal transduction histidine kinase/ligand-binding sensor domain-containing protein